MGSVWQQDANMVATKYNTIVLSRITDTKAEIVLYTGSHHNCRTLHCSSTEKPPGRNRD